MKKRRKQEKVRKRKKEGRKWFVGTGARGRQRREVGRGALENGGRERGRKIKG